MAIEVRSGRALERSLNMGKRSPGSGLRRVLQARSRAAGEVLPCRPPVALYLIRTATAVRRDDWDGANPDRPLTAAGQAQAAEIVSWLAQVSVSGVLSSPYRRCVETVEPLALRHTVPIELVEMLQPGGSAEAVLELLHNLPDRVVLCSHNKLITVVTEILTRQGAAIEGPSDFRRGSAWVIERTNGRIERLHVIPAKDSAPANT